MTRLKRIQLLDISSGEAVPGAVLEGDEAEAVLAVVKALRENKAKARREAQAKFLVDSAVRVEEFADQVNEALGNPLIRGLTGSLGAAGSERYYYRGLEFRVCDDDLYGVGQLEDGGTLPPVPDA